MNCKLVLEELEKAPAIGRKKYYNEHTGLYCAIGWLCRDEYNAGEEYLLPVAKRKYGISESQAYCIIEANDKCKTSVRKISMINFIKREFCKDELQTTS